MLVLAAGDGADDHQRFFAGGNGLGQRRVGRLVGQIFLAGEKSQERAALEPVFPEEEEVLTVKILLRLQCKIGDKERLGGEARREGSGEGEEGRRGGGVGRELRRCRRT